MLRAFLTILLMIPGTALADERILGVWVNADESVRLDILDGFKPNRGAVLAIENGTELRIGDWETKGSVTTMQIGWRSSVVNVWAPGTIEWNDSGFNKKQDITEENVVSLKSDETGFIDQLTGQVWLTSTEGRTSRFQSTFSTDSGVVETFSRDGNLAALTSWGVASGVLKVGRNVIIEARASQEYMVGINESDDFVIFRATGPVNTSDRTDLATKRAEFLSLLVTDTWQQVYYDTYRDYKFRPIEGPFRGRRVYFENSRLEGSATWEYSPSTGALKVGHTEYVGGLIVGDLLALLEEDGDQSFFKKSPGGLGRVFTMSDVRTHDVDETKGSELAVVLSGQFQRESYLYSFEFNEDNRTGFMHQWRSEPFTITGHELTTKLLRRAEKIYEVEDILLFDDRFVLKRDATASRLRPKTQSEVLTDKTRMEERLQQLSETELVLRITGRDGDSHDILLPYSSMSEVSEIQITTQ